MITTIEKILFLKGIPLFEKIPAREISSIAAVADEIEYKSGDIIFNEGDEGDALYLIVEGTVFVYSGDKGYTELGEGQCFGEMAVLDSEPRSASVKAKTDVVLLRIAQENFSDLLMEKPEIARGVLLVLTQRVRQASKRG